MKIVNVFVAVLWFILGSAIVIYTYNWLFIFGGMFEDDFAKALYYIGVYVMIIFLVFIIPIWLVVDATKETETVEVA